jgi:hypothetical protein
MTMADAVIDASMLRPALSAQITLFLRHLTQAAATDPAVAR